MLKVKYIGEEPHVVVLAGSLYVKFKHKEVKELPEQAAKHLLSLKDFAAQEEDKDEQDKVEQAKIMPSLAPLRRRSKKE